MRHDLPIRHVIQKLDTTGDALPCVQFLGGADGDWCFLETPRDEYVFADQREATEWVEENRAQHSGPGISLIIAAYRHDAQGRAHTLIPVCTARAHVTPQETYERLEKQHLA